MKNKFVISWKNIPVKIPINGIVTYSFIMYYFKVPQWAWGVWITLVAIALIVLIIEKSRETHVKIDDEWFIWHKTKMEKKEAENAN